MREQFGNSHAQKVLQNEDFLAQQTVPILTPFKI
jgi:hypothetical protein